MLPGFLVGALALQIRGDLDVSVEAVAAGVTVFFLAGAFGAGPGGRLAERLGAAGGDAGLRARDRRLPGRRGRRWPSRWRVLLALLAVAGLANAVNQPAINLFMAEQVPLDRQGLAFGIKQSAIPGAILVSGLALPLLALPLGWRATFALCALGPLGGGRGPQPQRAAPASAGGARAARPAPSRELLFIAVGAALASAGPNALGTYLVASAVDAGIAEGTAGLLAALGSAVSLAVRVALGVRADRRRDYGYGVVVLLLAGGAAGFLLLTFDVPAPFVIGALVAFAFGWGWPGLFNLAVVQSHRDAPGAATGVTQTGIYVGASPARPPSERSRPRPATRPPGSPAPRWRCWRPWCWRGSAAVRLCARRRRGRRATERSGDTPDPYACGVALDWV